jgi:ribosomal protein S18 acetylase RimI-like enzyme
MLYHAIFVPAGELAPPQSIVDSPGLAPYIAAFGERDGDTRVIAQIDGRSVGAAWARLIRGYGFVSADVPELSIAVLPDLRGRVTGTLLLRLFEALKPRFAAVSLSVHKANPAARLYVRVGFEQVGADGDTLILVRSLTDTH